MLNDIELTKNKLARKILKTHSTYTIDLEDVCKPAEELYWSTAALLLKALPKERKITSGISLMS